MCGLSAPSIKMPAPPAPVQAESLKTVTPDAMAARDNTNRRLAAQLSLKRTQATGPGGLTGTPMVSNKRLLGE